MIDVVRQRKDNFALFEPIARRFAHDLALWHRAMWAHDQGLWNRDHMDFASVKDAIKGPLHRPPYVKQIGDSDEAYMFEFNSWCWVAVKSIRPKAGAHTQITWGPAEVIHEATVGAGRTEFENDTDTAIERSKLLKRESEESTGWAKEIGVAASLSFRQLFKGEGLGFTSESELTATLESHADFSQEGNRRSLVATEETYSGTIPPNTTRYVEWLLRMGRYRQQCTIRGAIDYTIEAFSHNDFYARWDSQEDLRACLEGVGVQRDTTWDPFLDGSVPFAPNRTSPNPSNMAAVFNQRPIRQYVPDEDFDWVISMLTGPKFAEVTVTSEFDRANNDRWKVRDVPLAA